MVHSFTIHAAYIISLSINTDRSPRWWVAGAQLSTQLHAQASRSGSLHSVFNARGAPTKTNRSSPFQPTSSQKKRRHKPPAVVANSQETSAGGEQQEHKTMPQERVGGKQEQQMTTFEERRWKNLRPRLQKNSQWNHGNLQNRRRWKSIACYNKTLSTNRLQNPGSDQLYKWIRGLVKT